MVKLLSYYTDCVSYFSSKNEPIADYFKGKIQDVTKEITIFTSKK